MASHSHHHAGAQQASSQPRRSRHSMNPPLQTQNLRQDPRFSWTETPIQAQQPFLREQHGSPTTTIIDDSPLTASTAAPPMNFSSPRAPVAAPPSSYVEEKAAPVVPQQQVHPAHFAPYAEPERNQPHREQNQPLLNSEPTSPDQHAQPTAQWPPSAPPIPSSPPSTHQISLDNKPPLTPRTPSYTPHSPFGPNTVQSHQSTPNLSAHLPGQIPHPNASAKPTFSSSLLSVDGDCLHGCFLPCTLYSRTSFRLSQKSAHKDPTNLLSHTTCDGNSWLYGLTCGLCGVLACLERGRVRRGYGIEGGVVEDYIRSCCCTPCVLGQGEREVREREERWRRNEGPSQGYRMEGGMVYEPPPK